MNIKVLIINTADGFYKVKRYKLGDFFGPVDLGLHLSGQMNCLNIGTGIFAGSIFPGSNRLIVNGFSPCWRGFYISTMGGAGLVFDNLGINMLSLTGKAATPSVLYLNRTHGEEIEVEIRPIKVDDIWQEGRGGVYGLMDHVLEKNLDRYAATPRVLAVGPGAATTDFGAICSAPVVNGKNSFVDTWAGRGGFGSKMLQEHGIAAVIYGGTHIDEDFRDRKVADVWFEEKYQKNLAIKDLEATAKYRFDTKFNTGGTFGVNYATVGGRMMFNNYKSIYLPEDERKDIHKRFVLDHYLKQFNEETIIPKNQKTCGEPCAAVCKKMNGEFKKDYEPYQTFGPLAGIFDQRAAEKLNHFADQMGLDAISGGGVVSWLMECLADGLITPKEMGITEMPKFDMQNFDVVNDSALNAEVGKQILDSIVKQKGVLNLTDGARKMGRRLSRTKGVNLLDRFVFSAFGRQGWMVPNQYWTPGALAPLAISGKYFMHYGSDFINPRTLGKINADRLKKELILDNLGFCRFHRGWAEEMLPEIMDILFSSKQNYLDNIAITASRINSRNVSVFWESERNIDFVHTFIKRFKEVEHGIGEDLDKWLAYFDKDKHAAALDFWYDMHKGLHESLREFK